MDKFPAASAHQILNGLWLADHRAVIDAALLKDNKIDSIINCTCSFAFPTSIRAKHTLRVKLIDDRSDKQQDNMYKAIPYVVDRLFKWLSNGSIVLIHCHAGAQRSASLVVAFLMKYANMNLKSSINAVQSKRPGALTPVNFLPALQAWEDELNE